MSKHMRYINLLLEEKGTDLEQLFTVNAPDGTPNIMPYAVVVEHIAIAPESEQAAIAGMLRRIDFQNGDVRHYLRHLAGAIAASF